MSYIHMCTMYNYRPQVPLWYTLYQLVLKPSVCQGIESTVHDSSYILIVMKPYFGLASCLLTFSEVMSNLYMYIDGMYNK